MSIKIKQMMLFDPQCEHDNLVLCFKNEVNFNVINEDQFICDIPLATAIQIYRYGNIYLANSPIDIDVEVQNYLKSEISKRDKLEG
jgi:hypothetical protein